VNFYVPAYLGLVWALVGLLALPIHLVRYREDGVLRRLRASAAPRWAIFGSQAFVASTIGHWCLLGDRVGDRLLALERLRASAPRILEIRPTRRQNAGDDVGW
jgi:hypothetical protein